MAEAFAMGSKERESWSGEYQVRANSAPQQGPSHSMGSSLELSPMEWAQPHGAQKVSEVWFGERSSVGRKIRHHGSRF